MQAATKDCSFPSRSGTRDELAWACWGSSSTPAKSGASGTAHVDLARHQTLTGWPCLAGPADSSFLVIASRGNPWHWLLSRVLHVFFRAVRGSGSDPGVRQPVTPEACRCCFLSELSSPSCGGAKPSLGLSCQRWGCRARPPLPELGCYAGYRVPRQGIGHMEVRPVVRLVPSCMLVSGAILMFSPSRRSAGIQSLLVLPKQVCR